MNFQQKLDAIVEKNNSLLCVGLDPVLEKFPKHLQQTKHPLFAFLKDIVDSTHDLVSCYKPNSAFFEALGEKGVGELKKICNYIQTNYPEIPILLDFKRGDIGSTNGGYTQFAFDYLGADGVTVQPYLGKEALAPFLERKEKGIFILCKTSNPGSGEFQNMLVIPAKAGNALGKLAPSGQIQKKEWIPDQVRDDNFVPLYLHVAQQVSENWNYNNNCFLVVGATYPEELKKVRDIIGDLTLLVPGVGAQGGGVKTLVKAGLNSRKAGLIINSSREILYAGSGRDFAQKAREKAKMLRDEINRYRVFKKL